MSSYHIKFFTTKIFVYNSFVLENNEVKPWMNHFTSSLRLERWVLENFILSIIFHIVSSRRFLLLLIFVGKGKNDEIHKHISRLYVVRRNARIYDTRSRHSRDERAWWCLYLYEYFKWRTTFKRRRKKLVWGHTPYFKLNSSSDRHQLGYLQIVIWDRVERRANGNFISSSVRLLTREKSPN